MKNGKLCAIFDFGMLGVGDPSCVLQWLGLFLFLVAESHIRMY
ncbi:hypothetical protein [Ornithinibacillus bavariensis]